MKRKAFGTTFALLLVTMALCMIALVNAQFTDISVMNPDTQDSNFLYDSSAAVGSRFNATVVVTNVTDLFAYQVNLNVTDDSLLNITNAWIPNWDPEFVFDGRTIFPVPPAFYDDDADNITERVLVGSTILVGDTFNGSGLLAMVEFEIIYAPPSGSVSCNFDIDNIDTYLLDFTLAEITDVGKNAGYYEYSSVPVDITPPDIHSVTQQPANDSVTPIDKVVVFANVTDDESGVKQVILNYTVNNNGTWFNEEMMLFGGLYNATIREFDFCNDITYVVMAEDNADNTITTEEMGYTYTYHVIPEFPLVMVLLLALILTTIVVFVGKRRLLEEAPSNRFYLH